MTVFLKNVRINTVLVRAVALEFLRSIKLEIHPPRLIAIISLHCVTEVYY